jgi:2-C-methyl-D-erythritol 2,4-cyclodiphosphate synthase
MRIGQSSDIHRMTEGRKLVLGGVEIPYEKGLLGHSDADALTHALAEAILGALALGDLGKHFPDTDPKWEGCDSLIILRECAWMMRERGFRLGNVDSLVMIEKPKMAPHIEAMRKNFADALETDMEIKDFMETDIFLRFVFFEELIDGCGDISWRRSLTELGGGGCLSISGGYGSVSLMAAALAEQGGLQLLDESLRQRLHCIGENHIHAEEVIASLNNVVDLDGLFVGEDAVGFIENFNLISGQPVAGHASVAVDHVDLQIFIEAEILFAVALLE